MEKNPTMITNFLLQQNCAKKQFEILCHKGGLCMHGHIYIYIYIYIYTYIQYTYVDICACQFRCTNLGIPIYVEIQENIIEPQLPRLQTA